MDFDVWPFNSSMFALLYAVLWLFALLGAVSLQVAVGDMLEGDPQRPSPLRIGVLPALDEILLFSWARSPARLRQALLAGAVAEGWLVEAPRAAGDPRPVFRVFADAAPQPPLRPLHDELSRLPQTFDARAASQAAVRAAARVALDGHYDEALARAGLRRGGLARAGSVAVFVAFAGAIFLFGAGHALAEQLRPFAELVFLVVGPVALLGAALVAGREGRTLRAYRHWLEEHTVALTEDVAAGARTAPEDVALAVALRGRRLLRRSPLPSSLLPLGGLLLPEAPVQT